jgi:site-specific DNA recombinase
MPRPTRSNPATGALGYVRVSTDEQAREGVSIEAQASRIRACCEAKGIALLDVLGGSVDDPMDAGNLDHQGITLCVPELGSREMLA